MKNFIFARFRLRKENFPTWVRVLVATFVFLVVLTACSGRSTQWNGKFDYTHIMLSIDETDLYQYVGSVDYVFVGKVTQADTTITKENDESRYKIKVLENIKGKLADEIVCRKHGGILADGTMVLYATDRTSDTGIPDTGNTYIFMAYAQPDGSLLLSELYGNAEYTEEGLKEYRDYFENQKVCERKRFVSKYDISEKK